MQSASLVSPPCFNVFFGMGCLLGEEEHLSGIQECLSTLCMSSAPSICKVQNVLWLEKQTQMNMCLIYADTLLGHHPVGTLQLWEVDFSPEAASHQLLLPVDKSLPSSLQRGLELT